MLAGEKRPGTVTIAAKNKVALASSSGSPEVAQPAITFMTMEHKLKAEDAVSNVIQVLLGRKGFGDWWSDIRLEDKRDIRTELEEAIARHMLGDL